MLKYVISFWVKQDIIQLVVICSILLENSSRNSWNPTVDTIELVNEPFIGDLFQEWGHEITSPVENDQGLNITKSLIKLNLLLF